MKITSGKNYALRALVAVSLVATVAAWIIIPRLVESAYEGTSWTFLNDLISIQTGRSLQDYLDIVTLYLTAFSVGALLLSVFAALSTKPGQQAFEKKLPFVTSLNNTQVLAQKPYIWIGLAFVLGLLLRFLAASRGYNYDLVSYRIVADIMIKGGNVYAETSRYNYGPIWFHVLKFLDLIPWVGDNALWSLRWKVSIFLSMVDLTLSLALMRWFGWRAALLLWLNPISIIITGFHSQFDSLAILLGLVGTRLLPKKQPSSVYRHIPALAVLGLSLVVKHIFFFFPVWLAFKQDSTLKKTLYLLVPFGIFGLSFLPYLGDGGAHGIAQHVLLYKSSNNGPFWNGVAPVVVTDKLPLILAFLGSLTIAGLLYRKISPFESALRYLIVVVVFSSAVANQYLTIPLAAIAANWNIMYALYSAMGGIYLTVSGVGLHWPVALGSSGYDELIFVLFLGLLFHTVPRERLDQITRIAKVGVTWLKNEMVVQFRHCRPNREQDKGKQ